MNSDVNRPPLDSKRSTGLPLEPPIVGSPSDFHDPLAQSWEAFISTLSEPAYGAPRVFDLFTLMAITLAFGLLFGALKALDAIPEVFFAVTSFVTFVAIGQMLFFGGDSPRLASLVGGPIALVLTLSCVSMWYGRFQLVELVCSIPLGIPAGYLGGGLVAGVFLIADLLREKFSRHTEEADHNFWDEDN